MSRLSIFRFARRSDFSLGSAEILRLGCAIVLLFAPVTLLAQDDTAGSISREVKSLFERCGRAVVKIHAVDQHSELSGTGFFVDPAGTIYTSYSVAGEAENFTIEAGEKKYHARLLVADLRSGIALLKVDTITPFLTVGKSAALGLATPVVAIGYPLDLPETPSFGMIAGFDRKYLGRYFSTTHLRVNLPTQRGEAGAPLLDFKGEVVGILVSSVENGSACYALPIDAAEKIRTDFVRFGEARHGWIGINVEAASTAVDGSRAQMMEIMDGTPAVGSGVKAGDILLQVGNTQIHEPEDVIDASFFLSAGDTVPITVKRGNEKLIVNIQADFHPASKHTSIAASINPKTGIPLKLEVPPKKAP